MRWVERITWFASKIILQNLFLLVPCPILIDSLYSFLETLLCCAQNIWIPSCCFSRIYDNPSWAKNLVTFRQFYCSSLTHFLSGDLYPLSRSSSRCSPFVSDYDSDTSMPLFLLPSRYDWQEIRVIRIWHLDIHAWRYCRVFSQWHLQCNLIGQKSPAAELTASWRIHLPLLPVQLRTTDKRAGMRRVCTRAPTLMTNILVPRWSSKTIRKSFKSPPSSGRHSRFSRPGSSALGAYLSPTTYSSDEVRFVLFKWSWLRIVWFMWLETVWVVGKSVDPPLTTNCARYKYKSSLFT